MKERKINREREKFTKGHRDKRKKYRMGKECGDTKKEQ